MRCCQRRTLFYHSRTLVPNGHPVHSRAVPLLRLSQNLLQTQMDPSGTPAQTGRSYNFMFLFRVTCQSQVRRLEKEGQKAFHQPFTLPSWCISVSSSSFLNCAFDRSKSKSVSNLRVAEGTFVTMSWPCLRLLRLRAPKITSR